MKTKNYLLDEYNEVKYFDIPVRHYQTKRPLHQKVLFWTITVFAMAQFANLYQVIMMS